jgi:chromosome segregation ATPase
LTFPFFGFQDWATLLLELQPAALAIVAKKGTVIAASSEAAFAKESANPTRSQELHQSGTASEWMVANWEKDLKVVRQSITERRRAQKDAENQVEKIRQEYQRVQGQKSAHSRGLKDDIAKHEKRVSKFREEAEGFESKEKALLAQIAAEKSAAETVPDRGADSKVAQNSTASASSKTSFYPSKPAQKAGSVGEGSFM